MRTKIHSAKTKTAFRDAVSDLDVFVDTIFEELQRMQSAGVRFRTRGPKPLMSDTQLRHAIMCIWCVSFCGMQWRAVGHLSGLPFQTLYALFARWTRLGIWHRLMHRFGIQWRIACGDTPMPSTLVIDSRSIKSAPSCGFRGIDGGKRVRGVKMHIATDKHGSPMAVDVTKANVLDSVGIFGTLEDVAVLGCTGTLLGDLGYRGTKLDTYAKRLGMRGVEAVAGGSEGTFLPQGIRWTVERTFGWSSLYRRLNVIFERRGDHMIAFFEIRCGIVQTAFFVCLYMSIFGSKARLCGANYVIYFDVFQVFMIFLLRLIPSFGWEIA